jgi:hypothetical protein
MPVGCSQRDAVLTTCGVEAISDTAGPRQQARQSRRLAGSPGIEVSTVRHMTRTAPRQSSETTHAMVREPLPERATPVASDRPPRPRGLSDGPARMDAATLAADGFLGPERATPVASDRPPRPRGLSDGPARMDAATLAADGFLGRWRATGAPWSDFAVLRPVRALSRARAAVLDFRSPWAARPALHLRPAGLRRRLKACRRDVRF